MFKILNELTTSNIVEFFYSEELFNNRLNARLYLLSEGFIYNQEEGYFELKKDNYCRTAYIIKNN